MLRILGVLFRGLVSEGFVIAFFLVLAIKLNEPALWVVLLLGIVMVAVAFWQDEVRNGNGGS